MVKTHLKRPECDANRHIYSDMIDLYSQDVKDNPYPTYEKLRSTGRVIFEESQKVWIVPSYEEVRHVLRKSELFSSRNAGVEDTLLGADGLLHSRVRKMLQAAFSPTKIGSLNSAIQKEADRITENLNPTKETEFVSEIAGVVPTAVLSWMLNASSEDIPDLKNWSRVIMNLGDKRKRDKKTRSGSGLGIEGGIFRLRSKGADSSEFAKFEDFIKSHIGGTVRDESSGWVAELLAQKNQDGGLTDDELIDLGCLFVIAASETTTSFISSAILILARDRAQQEQLSDQTVDLEIFMEEVLRFESPVQRRPRYVSKETEIAGVKLSAGDRIVALIGSANRDSEMFESPDKFIPDRKPNQHLAFGAGPHFCIGSQLGKMEAKAMVGSILANLPPFRLARPSEKIEQNPYIMLRGPARLHLEFEN